MHAFLFVKKQGWEQHMVKEEEGKDKQQLSEPEPATSKSIVDPLAAETWSVQASINPFP